MQSLKESPITIALINGEQVKYDACFTMKNPPIKEGLVYLGHGRIYSVGGVLQDMSDTLHFWKKTQRLGEK